MIELSIAEIALFVWAAIATGYALRYKHEAYMAEIVLRKVIEDERQRRWAALEAAFKAGQAQGTTITVASGGGGAAGGDRKE